MNLRYSNVLKFPRKMVKFSLAALYPIVIKIFPLPVVRTIDETLDKLIEDKLSICRFGDGEFLYIIDQLNLPFQRQIPELRFKMIKILNSDDSSILVGLPIGYHSLSNLKRHSKLTWKSQIVWIYPRLKKFLPSNKVFYNASMTRLYMNYADNSKSSKYFEKVMRLWQNRDVVLIEGEKSRLGVGNDLFNLSSSVERILGPAHNAYDKYEDLIEEAKKQSKEKLILVAMGPTAKIIVYELAKLGYQAIDIGNLDVEYEWYLRGATTKVKIPGKYTSEAKGGRIVEDLINEDYNSQIIKDLSI